MSEGMCDVWLILQCTFIHLCCPSIASLHGNIASLFLSNLLSISLQCFVVYFHRCHDSTLKVCRAAVNEWEDHVAAMATDCPTFSRGVQHIFAALKEDCDGYEERLRHLEEVWGEGEREGSRSLHLVDFTEFTSQRRCILCGHLWCTKPLCLVNSAKPTRGATNLTRQASSKSYTLAQRTMCAREYVYIRI